MTQRDERTAVDRRSFLTQMAIGGAAVIAAGCSRSAMSSVGSAGTASAPLDWRERIGLQLYTVRDLTAKDYPGTLLRVAQIGYRQVQTTGSYGNYTAQQIHQFLDAAKLVSPATHVSPRVGPDFERTLEGYQMIGHKYTTVSFASAARPAVTATPAPMPAATPTGPRETRRETRDAVRRTAERLNEAGAITKKYGIKVIVHNHTEEFEPLADSSQRPWDVLLAETDPALVAMELDIGWATAAGENALDLFRRSPGRFEVWHVKDISNVSSLDASMDQPAKHRAAKVVPVGEGQIDYKPIFAQAKLAGMQHYFVEQDSAPASGDSMNDAAKSYRSLMKTLA
ncbi:MAG: sugar phosphate isomerase/epimerase [Gemmatimonadaceae bacterium]